MYKVVRRKSDGTEYTTYEANVGVGVQDLLEDAVSVTITPKPIVNEIIDFEEMIGQLETDITRLGSCVLVTRPQLWKIMRNYNIVKRVECLDLCGSSMVFKAVYDNGTGYDREVLLKCNV